MGAARMEDDQQFCLRWNNHQSTLVSVFDNLLEKGIHVDCTLAAEGKTLNAHKVVLSACSPYFENVLTQQYDKHPIIILKDVKWAELRAMMDYMYRGEVNISQDQLAALLKAAESLQIKGLSDNKPSRPPSHPAPPTPAPAPVPIQSMPQPPHVSSPAPQMMEGSIGSREGSISPSRKKKKRRNSAEVAAALTPVPQQPQPTPNDIPMTDDTLPQLKEENTRDGVEDLTIDEENDEPPATSHNDLVRNFAWHLDRSQDELGTDGGRDSQDFTARNSTYTQLRSDTSEAATFAVLKNVVLPVDAGTFKFVKTENVKENNQVLPEKALPFIKLPVFKPEKKYKCSKCARAYNAKKNLVRHVALECGKEPRFKCPYCSYSKHRRNELKKHVEKKHKKEYVCEKRPSKKYTYETEKKPGRQYSVVETEKKGKKYTDYESEKKPGRRFSEFETEKKTGRRFSEFEGEKKTGKLSLSLKPKRNQGKSSEE